MNKHPVVFVAFKQFDNLGIGYLASVLSNSGYKSTIIDFQSGKKEILKTLKSIKPLALGFSVIFQYHIYEFAELASYLRKNGIKCHFSAGGHYASLRYEELFSLIPSIDSVVRFEGEYTFLELVDCLNSGENWQKIDGIAFRQNGRVIANHLRQPEKDLDRFPYPARSPLEQYALGKKFATILAGRGCIHNCSFCSNRQYYIHSAGPFKRSRNPVNVVGEMEFLHYEHDCSVFLFLDDDFPVKVNSGSEWIRNFCKELDHRNLINKVMWKINCRPDEIDFHTFKLMKDHGLFLVFLGIDDGTDEGLIRLNKKMNARESLQGINILKKLDIGFDYGFMLFQPSSTFRSLNENLDFLRDICGDGYTPVTFLKLMPYFETRIEKELVKECRLKGKPGFFDYDFLDNSLNHYYEFIRDSFMEWLNYEDGFVNMSKWGRNHISTFTHFNKITPDILSLRMDIKNSVASGNLFLINTMKELATIFESGNYDPVKYGDLSSYRETIKTNHDEYREQLDNSIKNIYHLVEYYEILKLVEH